MSGTGARIRPMRTSPGPSKPIPLSPVADGMPRRVALQVLLGGVGAGFAPPSTADAQHPMHQHLSSPAMIEQAQQRAVVTGYTAAFLDEHQSKTLEAVAEAIVP